MITNRLLHLFFAGFFFFQVFYVFHENVRADERVEERPNFVIIISDDASFHDFGCWGNKDVKTPNIDKLADEGIRLTKFYSPAAVCSPLRQALLTGMFPVRNGAYPNHAKVYPGVRSLPHYMSELGYQSICVGKKHFNPPESFPFDFEIGMIGEDGNRSREKLSNLEQLEMFIKGSDEKPFCIYVASNEPHTPYNKGDASVYNAEELTLPPYMVDTPETRRALKNYYAEITHLDGQVGAVLGLLEKTGHENDTLVFFFSEQGSSFPHGKWTLYDVGIRVAAVARWPEKIKPKSENPALIQYVDLVPTLVELAGGDPEVCKTGRADADGKDGFDGKSFADVLFGKKDTLRDYAYAQHTSRGIIAGPEMYGTRAVTDGNWKLIYNIHHDKEFKNTAINTPIYKSWVAKGNEGDAFAKEQSERYRKRPEWELYDLKVDPWELKNVADNPENAETLKKLQKELRAWMKQQGDKGHETEMEAEQHQVR